MTSELRPAVEVWDDAIAAWAADTIDTRQAAAAVIQAYGDEREAKWKALAETAAAYIADLEDHEGAEGFSQSTVELRRKYEEACDERSLP